MHSENKKVFFFCFLFLKSFLPTYPIFSGCNLNHTYFCIWPHLNLINIEEFKELRANNVDAGSL